MSYVVVQNLLKRYGEVCAVDDLSFTVKKGEIFGLLGPNGAGKSTTLGIITALIGFDRGSVSIDGMDITREKDGIKRIIGMVPQDIAVYNQLTALENVKFFASLYGLKGSRLDRQAKEALDFVGLSDKAGLKPRMMSGGMKRRLNIACGIAHSPELIVMDEPTVGVDAQSREHILNSIKILRERGATVIYTSHYMQEVEEICDRIAIIDRGHLVACGTETELVSMITDVQSVYIETRVPKSFDRAEYKKRLMHMPGVRSMSFEENTLRIDISHEQDNKARILEEFISSRLPIINIRTEVPNLETLFLTLTGHELR